MVDGFDELECSLGILVSILTGAAVGDGLHRR